MTAVAPVVIRGGGIWVGWPGIHLDPNEKIPQSDPLDKTPTAGLLSEKVCFLFSITFTYLLAIVLSSSQLDIGLPVE